MITNIFKKLWAKLFGRPTRSTFDHKRLQYLMMYEPTHSIDYMKSGQSIAEDWKISSTELDPLSEIVLSRVSFDTKQKMAELAKEDIVNQINLQNQYITNINNV
jgi:hypothetical protein